MRILSTLLSIILIACPSTLVYAANPLPKELFLPVNGGNLYHEVAVTGGDTHSFLLKALIQKKMHLSIESEDDDCGFEISSGDRRGLFTTVAHFPVGLDYEAISGVTYKLSFFQLRMAFINNTACKFSMRLQ